MISGFYIPVIIFSIAFFGIIVCQIICFIKRRKHTTPGQYGGTITYGNAGNYESFWKTEIIKIFFSVYSFGS